MEYHTVAHQKITIVVSWWDEIWVCIQMLNFDIIIFGDIHQLSVEHVKAYLVWVLLAHLITYGRWVHIELCGHLSRSCLLQENTIFDVPSFF